MFVDKCLTLCYTDLVSCSRVLRYLYDNKSSRMSNFAIFAYIVVWKETRNLAATLLGRNCNFVTFLSVSRYLVVNKCAQCCGFIVRT